jgi:hypothetical protein
MNWQLQLDVKGARLRMAAGRGVMRGSRANKEIRTKRMIRQFIWRITLSHRALKKDTCA